MSGAIKSVSKTFKKALKSAKTLLPVALAAGAVFFTAGSALGLTPTFGEAVSGVVGKIGLGEAASRVLTGAITQAGVGSALGAGGALVTGGDPLKAAQIGTIAGTVTGGVSGAMGWDTDLAKGLASDERPDWFGNGGGVPSVAPNPAKVTSAPLGQPDPLDGIVSAAPGKGMDPTAASNLAREMGGGKATTITETGKPKGFFDKLFETQAGAGLAAGVGTGIINAATASDASSAAERRDAANRQAYAQNYGNPRGLLTHEQMAYLNGQPSRPKPGDRFAPATPPTARARYRFNSETNEIELLPA